MGRYLIQFRPVEDFFFGGEITFGDRITQNYLVRSNPFPQQTTVLGTLRKELLIQEGYLQVGKDGYNLIGEKAEIETLIGPESFDICKLKQTFGVIKKLSPVFLVKDAPSGKEFYVPAPAHLLSNGTRLELPPSALGGRTNVVWQDNDEIPFIKKYVAKNGLPELLINSVGNSLVPIDQVLIPSERVGISKGKGGVSQEKAFRKQTTYRLQKGFGFACIADLDYAVGPDSCLVFMGADKSAFIMLPESFSSSFADLFSRINPDPDKHVILLSDALVDRDIYESCRFAITQTVPFRNIKTSTGNYDFSKEKKLYGFLKRGSVLFPKYGSVEKIRHKLNQRPHLKMIGYNIFC